MIRSFYSCFVLIFLLPNVAYPDGFLGPDTTLCSGQCMELSTGYNPAFNYTWSTGETTPAITVCADSITAPDTISVIVENNIAIPVYYYDTIIIHVLIAMPPLEPSLSYYETCLGKCILLEGPSGGEKYSWVPATGLDSPDITNPEACIDSLNISYSVMVWPDTTLDCFYEYTIQIKAAPNPSAPVPFTEAFVCKDSCIIISGPSGGQRYSWIPADGLDNPDIKSPLACPPVGTTAYIVSTETDTNIDCIYKDTVTLSAMDTCYTGINDLNKNTTGWSIHLDPAAKEVYISTQSDAADVLVSLMNLSGQAIAEKSIRTYNTHNKNVINVRELQAGIYLIQLATNSSSFCQKIVLY